MTVVPLTPAEIEALSSAVLTYFAICMAVNLVKEFLLRNL